MTWILLDAFSCWVSEVDSDRWFTASMELYRPLARVDDDMIRHANMLAAPRIQAPGLTHAPQPMPRRMLMAG
jgi:hypothetical protein